ncbi:MAG: class I SAM-dependent methyltransferase [bacterium]
MNPRSHWERIYASRLPNELSWYQLHPQRSLDLIQKTGVSRTASILDVGGGDSTLVDHLIARDYERVAVLDLSESALSRARVRLGSSAGSVTWREADILDADVLPGSIDVWHDRAVFHFLTRPNDRAAYINQVRRMMRPQGHVIVATFAEDGPSQCSGLPVERYSAVALHAVFGGDFQLRTSVRDVHRTPSGAEQRFTYCWCTYHSRMSAAA